MKRQLMLRVHCIHLLKPVIFQKKQSVTRGGYSVERVGFIGVGMMGGAIAARMIENGVPVLAYDNNPGTLKAVASSGVTPAASVKDVADNVEIIFACLPDAGICRSVALDPGGIADGDRVTIYIETSTMGG